ncbi:MAG: hypothetical protein H6R01_1045 [Burkholderiaceae bacterium]|nr:hypothetical protein [Burkholderiaceae bacterium]
MSIEGKLKSHIARKEHRCDECGRKIPAGARYWRRHTEHDIDHREHTNCADFEREPVLHPEFNTNRGLKL